MHDDRIGEQFDVSSVEVGILSTFVTVADLSAYLDYTLGLKFGEELGKSLVFGVEHHLCFTLAIPQIEKEHASMVTERVDPTN